MKAGINLRFFFSLSVVLLGGYALYSSSQWPFRAALFPRVVALPLLFLAAAEMVLSVLSPEKETEGHAVDFQLTTDVDPVTTRKRTLMIFAWALGFLFMILLVGFLLAVPLFVFLYLKVAGKEGWTLTLLLTAVSWVFMEAIFNRLLHLPFPEGWLFSL